MIKYWFIDKTYLSTKKEHLFISHLNPTHTSLKTHSLTHSLTRTSTKIKRKRQQNIHTFAKLTRTHTYTLLKYAHKMMICTLQHNEMKPDLFVCLLVLNGIWIESPLWFLLQYWTYWTYWSYYWYIGNVVLWRGRAVFTALDIRGFSGHGIVVEDHMRMDLGIDCWIFS